MEELISKAEIAETVAAVPVTEKDFEDTTGKKATGYDTLDEVSDLIDPFKKFYIREKPFHAKRGDLIRAWKEKVLDETGRTFNVYPNAMYRIMDKLDKQLAKNPKYRLEDDMTPKETDVVAHNAQFRGAEVKKKRFAPATLEDGTMSLAESLLLDAKNLLDETNESAEDDEEVRIKKKGHVLNVFRHVAGVIQKGQMIDLKKKKEAREGAGFILDLIAKAQAGELTAEGMELMRGRIAPQPVLANDVTDDNEGDDDDSDDGFDIN